MDNEYIQALRKEVKKEFTADKARYWHTIGVAETSACLAMRYGVDMQKAFTAGLLHDCAKCYSDEQLIEICESNNIEITQAERLSPYLLHAKAGAFFAGTKYGIDDEDICNAIRYHSTGHPGMTPLEEIVFIADYMEPLRNKADNLDEIRALVFKDIKEAIYRVTLSTIEYLKKRNKPIEMVKSAIEAMKDKKAEDIRVIDISNVSVIADYFIIANGNNPNQVQAIVDNVEEQLYKAGFADPKVEGYNSASWILLDYEDVIIHVFSKEDRLFYNLERIWRDGIEVNPEEI